MVYKHGVVCHLIRITYAWYGLLGKSRICADNVLTDNTKSQKRVICRVRMSKAFLGLMLFLSIIPTFIGCSPADPLTDTVIKADLIVLGTITDNRSEVVMRKWSENTTGKFAYTLFTLSVEKVLKGDPSIKKVIIQVEGGYLGDGIYQGPTGGYFYMSDHVLVSLIRQDRDVYTLFEAPRKGKDILIENYRAGILWTQSSRISLQEILGRICKILRINGIPNPLNEPCIEPAEWPASPPKR